jgi:hypothetical protein
VAEAAAEMELVGVSAAGQRVWIVGAKDHLVWRRRRRIYSALSTQALTG